MKQPLPLIITIITLLVFSSCSLFTSSKRKKNKDDEMASLIMGWGEMLEEIEEKVSKIDELQNKSYKLVLALSGKWDLEVTPAQAFQVTPIKDEVGVFTIKIIQPEILFDKSSGIIKRGLIQAKLTKIGGTKGEFDVYSGLECMFSISFYQANGEKVNLDELANGFKYEFIISHPKILKIVRKDSTSITFSRPYGGDEEITVDLKLIEKDTLNKVEVDPVTIPYCIRPDAPNDAVRKIYRRPGQCLVHLKGGPQLFKDTSPTFQNLEIFGNNCPDPITCKVTAQYGLVSAGQVIKAGSKEWTFSVAAHDFKTLDTSFVHPHAHNMIFDTKVYTIPTTSLDGLPQQYAQSMTKDENFINCRWGTE